MLDLQYHDMRPDKGLYYLLERKRRGGARIVDDEIEAAIDNPAGRHPRILPRRVHPALCRMQVFGVNWDSISFNLGDEPIKRILMNEPLKGTRPTCRSCWIRARRPIWCETAPDGVRREARERDADHRDMPTEQRPDLPDGRGPDAEEEGRRRRRRLRRRRRATAPKKIAARRARS